MRELKMTDFSGSVGEPFEVETGGERFAFTLDVADELPSSGREGGSFRLEFLGPSEPVLPQAIYPFERGGETFEIFVVPIAQDRRGTRYEAIFF